MSFPTITAAAPDIERDDSALPLYTLDQVSFDIDGRAVLHPLTLELTAGRIYGLLGHNGSGKSTLLKLLARQYRPAGGEIRLAQTSLAAWNSRELARKIAYLPQQLPPADGMTVRELVALGRYPWHGALGRFSAADADKVERALHATHTAPLAERLVDGLSGGERQRVWLAMLVAQDSECLLLDEPISALDIRHQIDVLQLIRDLSTRHGLSVVVVLHDINMAARFCDRLIGLKQGRMMFSGSPDELMRASVLSDLYDVSMSTVDHPDGRSKIGFAL